MCKRCDQLTQELADAKKEVRIWAERAITNQGKRIADLEEGLYGLANATGKKGGKPSKKVGMGPAKLILLPSPSKVSN